MPRPLLAALLVLAVAGAIPAQASDPPGCPEASFPLVAPPESQGGGADGAEARCPLEPAPFPRSTLPAPTPPPPEPIPACLDGLDNDRDMHPDFPADPGCDGPLDPDERPACSDGVDNDGDGLADHGADPKCASPDGSEGECPTLPFLPCAGPGTCTPGSPSACGGGSACPASPLPPALVEGSWVGDGIVLHWMEALQEPLVYLVYRVAAGEPGLDDLMEPLGAVAGSATTFHDPTAVPGEVYAYWVTSAGEGCESPPSLPAIVGDTIPDTSDCLMLNLGRPPLGVDPEYKGTECLPL